MLDFVAPFLGDAYHSLPRNVISGITEYGVLITQSYPDSASLIPSLVFSSAISFMRSLLADDGTPGTSAPISYVHSVSI